MNTINVKNCRDCPFSEATIGNKDEVQWANCMFPGEAHANYKIDSYYENYKVPKWCPLKKDKLLIQWKQ